MTNGGSSLRRAITPFGAALLVLNGMIGAGIFVLPASVSAATGAWAPWLFLAVGLFFITIALSFAELASYFRDSGGPVLYAGTAFGPAAGFASGWMLWLGRVTAIAANINVVMTYLEPTWLWLADGPWRVPFIAAVCAVLVVTNIVGVKQGVRTVAMFTVLKLIPLLVLTALGLFAIGPNAMPGPAPSLGAMGTAALLFIYAFVGFEAALVTAGETRDPRRSLPRALVVTVAGTALLYWLLTLVYVAVLPAGGAEGKTLSDAAALLAGPAAAAIMTFTAIFSVAGNVASAMVTSPRMTYALAENKWLPRWFGHVHKTYATPDNSILLFGVAVFLFAASSTFVFLAAASSLARILIYILCILALPKLRRTLPKDAQEEAYRLPGGLLIPGIAFLLCVIASTQAALATWTIVAGIVAIGMGLFWLARRSAH
ncbi:MAG: APC family permease [Proteobacteria bacterium]|nr:APC family permease [Pseudomonadota bacterium]